MRGVAIIESPVTRQVGVAQIHHDAHDAGEYFKEVFARYGMGQTQLDFVLQANDVHAEYSKNYFRNAGSEFIYGVVWFKASDKEEIQNEVDHLSKNGGWHTDGTWRVNIVTGKITKVGGARRSTRKTCTCKRK